MDEERKDGKSWTVLCECTCGLRKFVKYTELRLGKSRSCLSCAGKLRMARELSENPGWWMDHLRRNAPVGVVARGAIHIPYTAEELAISRIMKGARGRCTNPKDKAYQNYGGRGIEFRFDSIAAAVKWVLEHLGPRPAGKSIDRIDNNGHYEPGNLRWATNVEQARNKREYKIGERGTRLRKLCALRPDYTYEGLRKFVVLGMSDEEILAMPRPKTGRPRKDASTCI